MVQLVYECRKDSRVIEHIEPDEFYLGQVHKGIHSLLRIFTCAKLSDHLFYTFYLI